MGDIGTLAVITSSGPLEDHYFLSNPDITFFKSVYRRHTNFSKFTYEHSRDAGSENDNNFGDEITFTIQNGAADLLSKLYLQHKITFTPDDAATELKICSNIGTSIISNDKNAMTLEIGGTTVFAHNGIYLETKNQLLNQYVNSSFDGYSAPPILTYDRKIIDCNSGSQFNYMSLSGGCGGITITKDAWGDSTVFTTGYFYTIPDFSFNYDTGLAIPLLCLDNHEIIFKVKYNTFDKVIYWGGDGSSGEKLESNVFAELIHLDIDERARFKLSDHEYLIESVQNLDEGGNDIGAGTDTTLLLSGVNSLMKYILIVGDDNKGFDMQNDPSTSKSSNTPTSLNAVGSINISFDNAKLYDESSSSLEVFTKHNMHNYFKGSGRDVSGSDLAQIGGLIITSDPDFEHVWGVAWPLANGTAAVAAGVTFSITYTDVFKNIPVGAMIKSVIGVLPNSGLGDPGQDNLFERGIRIIVTEVTSSTVTFQNMESIVATSYLVTQFLGNLATWSAITFTLGKHYGYNNSIAVIPFCLEPMNYTQPSGCISTFNFSQIQLIITPVNTTKALIKFFIVGYNILSISGGQCAIKFH